MSVKRVLFIDDNRIDNQIDKLRKKLKGNGYVLDEVFLDLSQDQFKKRDEKTGAISLDFDKIKEHMKQHYFSENFDIVASDFDYSDAKLDGYSLLKWVINVSRSDRYRIRKAKFCLYSTQQDKLVNVLDTPEHVRDLIRLKIDDFISRDRLPEEVSILIQKPAETFKFSEYVVDYMEKHPQFIFRNVYPKFKDKKLSDIAHEIDVESPHGIEFQRFLTELTLAHLIDLNGFNGDD